MDPTIDRQSDRPRCSTLQPWALPAADAISSHPEFEPEIRTSRQRPVVGTGRKKMTLSKIMFSGPEFEHVLFSQLKIIPVVGMERFWALAFAIPRSFRFLAICTWWDSHSWTMTTWCRETQSQTEMRVFCTTPAKKSTFFVCVDFVHLRNLFHATRCQTILETNKLNWNDLGIPRQIFNTILEWKFRVACWRVRFKSGTFTSWVVVSIEFCLWCNHLTCP